MYVLVYKLRDLVEVVAVLLEARADDVEVLAGQLLYMCFCCSCSFVLITA